MVSGEGIRRCVVCHAPLEGERYARTSFCSNRCRKIDLARWLNEEYRIREEGENATESDEEASGFGQGEEQ